MAAIVGGTTSRLGGKFANSAVSRAAKVVGMKSIGYMGSNAITGYVPKRAISTLSGKLDATVTTAGVLNIANAMNRE